MAGISVNIRGIRRTIDNMEQFEEKIVNAVKKGMEKTALTDIERGAKRKIASDGHIDTGRLRASIHTNYGNNTTHNYSDQLGNSFSESLINVSQEFKIMVGTAVEYAIYIEDMDSFLYYAYNKGIRKMPKRIKKEVNKVLRGG